jgi:hypothetical protein
LYWVDASRIDIGHLYELLSGDDRQPNTTREEVLKMHFKICFEGEAKPMSTVTGSFTVTVAPTTPPPNPLVMTPQGGNLPGETQGSPDAGDQVAQVSGGQPPYGFEITGGALPPGMSLAETANADGSSTVTIEGTPTQSGAFSFNLTVTDTAGATANVAAKRTI